MIIMRKELEDRLVLLSLNIEKISRGLNEGFMSEHLSKQIIRSSSSAALNYGEAQAAESGFWTSEPGTVYGTKGSYWEYYGLWAPDTFTKTYDEATFDEKWQNGFWVDDDGTVGDGDDQGHPQHQ